jgi:glycosyltransferase involved in cell wall biosynthesis
VPAPARILFVSQTAKSAGPTTSLGLLLDRLSEDHRVSVLVRGEGEFTRALAARAVPFWSLPSLGNRRMPQVLRLLRRERFDLVYANETSWASRNACLMATLVGIPFVSHVRSIGWRHGWRRLGHLRLARAVIAVSRACADSVARYVPPGRLHVVHNGIPCSGRPVRDAAERARVREELGLGPEARLILNVGHLSPRKGQEYSLEAMERVVAELPDTHLCFVGAHDRDGAYVRRIEELARERGTAKHVTLLGFRTDVDRLLAAADVVLHTPLADPHPRAVLEAMAAAVPVVAFSTDGVVETVVDGETGYLVDQGDTQAAAGALIRVLGSNGHARRLGEAGRARVEAEFSEAETAERVRRILKQVLEGEGR